MAGIQPLLDIGFNSLSQGLTNIFSGGNWIDSGATLSARRFASAEAEKNRKWQEKMSNTAYQRAVTDLKSAGLNPALAYQNGSATTPTGSVASSNAVSDVPKPATARQVRESMLSTAKQGIEMVGSAVKLMQYLGAF